MLQVLTFLLMGLLWGVRHSIEPDHVAAMSLFGSTSSTRRQSIKRALLWSGGHMLSLFIIAAIFFLFRISLPEAIISWAERSIGFLLVVLGLVLLFGLLKKGNSNIRFSGSSSFVIGIGHGVAGSGLLLLGLISLSQPPYAAFLYLLFFGVGMAASMALIGILVHAAVAKWRVAILKISALIAFVTGVLMVTYSDILARP